MSDSNIMKISAGADSEPLLMAEEKKDPPAPQPAAEPPKEAPKEEPPKEEPAKKQEREEVLRLPDPIIRSDYKLDPEITPHRWFILVGFTLSIFCVGCIASFYNCLEVLLVDVFFNDLHMKI